MKLSSLFALSKELKLFLTDDGDGSPYMKASGGDGTLKGCPEKISDSFDCSDLKLRTFEGGPKEIKGYLYADRNMFTSLKGAPRKINGYFSCELNKDLKAFDCDPMEIEGALFLNRTGFTSLKDIHKYITKIGYVATFDEVPIKSHVLGLFLIDGLGKVYFDNKELMNILNKHLENPDKKKGMIGAQRELIDNDLDDFAEV